MANRKTHYRRRPRKRLCDRRPLTLTPNNELTRAQPKLHENIGDEKTTSEILSDFADGVRRTTIGTVLAAAGGVVLVTGMVGIAQGIMIADLKLAAESIVLSKEGAFLIANGLPYVVDGLTTAVPAAAQLCKRFLQKVKHWWKNWKTRKSTKCVPQYAAQYAFAT